MTAPANLLGQHFERLTVIARAENTRHSKAQWLCQCECGEFVIVHGTNLRSSHTRSCGCFRREISSGLRASHRMSHSPEYRIFAAMIYRCTNPRENRWESYGGRGIRCLFESFEEFYAEVGPRPSPRHTIERKDNDGHYAKGNIMWATRKEQNRNTRKNILVTHNGRTQCLAAWAEELHIHPQALYRRYRKHKRLI